MDKLDVLGVLKGAREKLSRPGGWMKGDFAADDAGEPVDSWEPSAVCYCAVGAIDSVATTPDLMEGAREALRVELRARGLGDGVARFNDQQESVQPVLDLFDAAIARLESEVA